MKPHAGAAKQRQKEAVAQYKYLAIAGWSKRDANGERHWMPFVAVCEANGKPVAECIDSKNPPPGVDVDTLDLQEIYAVPENP